MPGSARRPLVLELRLTFQPHLEALLFVEALLFSLLVLLQPLLTIGLELCRASLVGVCFEIFYCTPVAQIKGITSGVLF
eukprot:3824602-Pleurochrysis_carterae.AAC.2